MRIAVVGAGITGLALTYYLEQAGHTVDLFEASDRVGGWIRTIEKEGFLFELGARSLRGLPPLVHDLGLHPIVAKTKRRYLQRGGKLERLRPSLRLLIGKKSLPEEDCSVKDWAIHCFGQATFERFIEPMVLGIYAGDASQLSMHACFPNGWKHKRLGIYSFEKGMETLTRALEETIQGPIHLNSPITNFDTLDHEKIYCTLPPHILGPILDDDYLNSIPMQSLSLICLGYNHPLDHPKGFGYLVPSSEKSNLLGVVFDSDLFPRKGTTFTCMVREGFDHPFPSPDVIHCERIDKAIAQYPVDHLEELKKLGQRYPALTLIGAGLTGVSVSRLIEQAQLEVTSLPK